MIQAWICSDPSEQLERCSLVLLPLASPGIQALDPDNGPLSLASPSVNRCRRWVDSISPRFQPLV